MATFTLNDQQKFAVGTTVNVYAAAARREAAAPDGASVTSGAMTATGVTFAGLSNSTRYVAYALVSGEHRYVGFVTPPLVGDGLAGVMAPPGLQSGAVTLVAQRACFARFVLDRPRSFVNAKHVVSTVAGSAVNPTLERAVYDASGAMIGASSGFVAAKLNALGPQAIPLVKNLPAGVYYDGMMCPDLLLGTGAILTGWNPGTVQAYTPLGAGIGDALVIQMASQATLPAQIVAGSVSGANPQGFLSEA